MTRHSPKVLWETKLPDKKNSYPPINALLRGLELLTHINALGLATVGALHRRTGISKPTIVRNLETLEHAGFVARDGKRDGYVPTAKVLSLSSGYDRDQRLVEIATPILNAFRETMPWPSDLAVFDGDAMVILETSRNPGTLALNRPVGARLSVTESALGRAYLAFTEDQERAAILDARFGEGGTDRAARTRFEKALDHYREQGFSENDQSLSENTRGVGVPVMAGPRVVACINTIVLTEAMSMSDVISRCVPPLQSVAQQIGSALVRDRQETP